MARYVRNTAILAKVETTYGTDASPTGTANAMLVSNLSINPLNAGNVDRDNIRSYFGANEQLVGTAYVECGFDVELVGRGTAGVAPAWGALMKGCGWSETTSSGTRVEYLPTTPGTDGLTIYWYDDGALHKVIGARGTFSIRATIGTRPVLSFRFLGLDAGVTAAAVASTTLTAFQTPQVVTDSNTGDVSLNGTYATTPAYNNGTAYVSQGIEIDVGNQVVHTPLLGGETVDITGRTVSARFNLDLTGTQEASFMTSVKANTTTSFGFSHGTATGYRTMIYGPAMQLINPTKVDTNGRRLIGFEARFVPSTGNDELRIVTSY